MAYSDFIKQNAASNSAGKLGKGFIAFDIANLVTSENKMKALLQLFKDLILLKPIINTAFAGLFLAMGRSIRSLVHDTGSLETALKKLSQIQSLQRMFSPLVGGLAAAKLKVAELVNFAASRNLKIGDAASAERSLMLMTRGGFSGAKALDVVNDAAQATGNSVTDMASAVGDFADQLRSGGSIAAAAEQLRTMGAVTDQDAESLKQLQENGASAGRIFTVLTTSLERFHGGAKSASEDLDSINVAYESAAANLQNKFASPFVESDIQNTKNMTAAMNAVAPSVSRVSGFLAILVNAFSTTKTWAAKTAAESSAMRAVLEGLIYVVTGLITAVSAIAAVGLAVWLIGASSAAAGLAASFIGLTGATGALATAITALGVAARVALVASGIGIFIALAATAAGVAMQWSVSAERSAKALQDLAMAQRDANAALLEQIKNVRTLTQRNDVLAKSLDAVTAAQLALNEATKTGDKDRIANAEGALALAEKTARHANRIKTESLAPVEERQQADRDRVARELAQREERFQAEMSQSTPERQARLLAQHADEAAAKAKKGAIGERERIKFAEESADADMRVLERQKQVDLARAKLETATTVAAGPFGQNDLQARDARMAQDEAAKQLTIAQQALADARAHQAGVGLKASPGSSVQLEAAQRAMLAGDDLDKVRKAAALGLEAERARQIEAMRGENELIALRDREAAKAIDREHKLNKMATERELALQNIAAGAPSGRIGDERPSIQRGGIFEGTVAEAHGQGQRGFDPSAGKTPEQAKQAIEDLSVFANKMEELLGQGFSQSEAERLANQFSSNAITLDTRATMGDAAANTVADSLTRIGGGGGVYSPSGDPLLTAAQRQVQLQEEEVGYLKALAEAGKKGGVL